MRENMKMSNQVVLQNPIDPDLQDRAAQVLAPLGLTVSDVVLALLTHIADEGAVPSDLRNVPDAYDTWFRRKIQEALDDPHPGIPHDDVEAYFAKRRATALQKAEASTR